MKLFYLTGRSGADPKRAGRVLVDTNVAAPALRWIALGAGRPSPDVVEAFAWMQRLATSTLVSGRALSLNLQWAGHETSRDQGKVDGDRLARIHAANVVLLDWLFGFKPIKHLFDGDAPRIRPLQQVRDMSHGTPDSAAITAESVALIHLSRLHEGRRAGDLRGPKQRLDALEEWAEVVAPLEALSADLVLIAVQTALAGDGAPARAMCKFNHYIDRRSARATASNAAWDLQFMRLMRASEAGLGEYVGQGRATTLLTFDQQLAAAALDLNYLQRVDGVTGQTFITQVSVREHLQNDMLRDSAMLDRLDAWCDALNALQRERWGKPRTTFAADMEGLLSQALTSRFPD